jgi:hypothetical protein
MGTLRYLVSAWSKAFVSRHFAKSKMLLEAKKMGANQETQLVWGAVLL